MSVEPKWSYTQLGVASGRPVTLGEYKRLNESGRLTRPLTDSLIGAGSQDRRAAGARQSELVSSLSSDGPRIPERSFKNRPLKPAGRRDGPTSTLELRERDYRRARLFGPDKRRSAGERTSRRPLVSEQDRLVIEP